MERQRLLPRGETRRRGDDVATPARDRAERRRVEHVVVPAPRDRAEVGIDPVRADNIASELTAASAHRGADDTARGQIGTVTGDQVGRAARGFDPERSLVVDPHFQGTRIPCPQELGGRVGPDIPRA
jgi:hypothetical protein